MREITLEAKTENLDRLTEFIHEDLGQTSCSKKTRFQIDMAVEELFVNICRYAYAPNTGTANIRTELYREPDRVSITFTDSGIPYNPLKKLDPDLSLSIEERPIGGMGIYLVKEKMDDVSYEYKDGHNVLTITKILV